MALHTLTPRAGAYCGTYPRVPTGYYRVLVPYHGTSYTVFTRPILSGYLTKINETRIVKLRKNLGDLIRGHIIEGGTTKWYSA